MPTLMTRLYAAARAFREPDMFADPDGRGRSGHLHGRDEDWGAFDVRQRRYRTYWALAQQQAYRDWLDSSAGQRAAYGLYEGIRDLFGVAHQLNEFWTAHLHGGDLDPLAGDGKTAPSCLPIMMDAENPAVRVGLAELWKRSNFMIAKDVLARFGSATGDGFWEVCDDTQGETVRLNAVSAGRVKWCDTSPEGNVEAYELEFYRPDPRQAPAGETRDAPRAPQVLYNEVVTPAPDGGAGYLWKTYLNGEAYAWPGNEGPQWVITDLPFAPLVKVQHKNIGMGWGAAEVSAALTSSREVADLASCFTDWARKEFNAPHLLSGMLDPALDAASQARAAARPPTPAQQRSGLNGDYYAGGQAAAEADARNKKNYLYVKDPGASATPLVLPIPGDAIGAQIDRLRAKLLEDYPELSFERIRSSGHVSAEAIREARKPAEAKVLARRVEYDAGAARAFRMALTIGGLRGYRHYEPFNAGSYDDGALDFRIGSRPAFAPDPSEVIAERLARYAALKAATDAGLPLALGMREAGYSDKDIADVEAKAAADEAKLAQQQKDHMKLAMSQGFADGGSAQ